MTLRPLSTLVVAVALGGYALPAHATDAVLSLSKISANVDAAHVTCAATPYSDDAYSTGIYRVTLSGLTSPKLAGLTSALASSSGAYGVFLEWTHVVYELNGAWAEAASLGTLHVNGARVGTGATNATTLAGEVDFFLTPYATVPTLVNGDVIEVQVLSSSHAECTSFTSFDQAQAKGKPTWSGAEIRYSY